MNLLPHISRPWLVTCFLFCLSCQMFILFFCFLLSFDPCFVLRNNQYKIKTFGSMFSSPKSSRKEKLYFLVAKYLVDIDMFSPFLIHLPPTTTRKRVVVFPKFMKGFVWQGVCLCFCALACMHISVDTRKQGYLSMLLKAWPGTEGNIYIGIFNCRITVH